ncbi:unnamed protein product [Pocillopora meandrina]|uniref:G-protein coupled receptors family 3 profile domain-containing protein n=1 Tax=Pocillopora meandrina TaxID=46732 RepID=A0AAU9XR74_9CNID|nr:unnamed protein product [Pocillopora meandrina]
MNKPKKTVIQDYQLIIVVILLLMIDACVLSTWQILDPIYTTSKTFPRRIDQDADIAIYPYQTFCTSKYENLWTGLLYGYKGFLLLFCTYLAWETRNCPHASAKRFQADRLCCVQCVHSLCHYHTKTEPIGESQ